VLEASPLALVRGDEDVDIHDIEQTSGVHPEGQVVTGEAVAVELRLAGAGSRGIAAMIDIAIMTAAEIILLIVIGLLGPGTNLATLITVFIVIELSIVVGYPVAMETLWRGRTLGKAWMGLRVVRDDGGPIRFRHALVRGLTGVVLEKPGPFLGAPALVFILVGGRNKRIGDLFAGTIVLQERVPGNLEAPVMMPPPLAGWAASLDLSGLDDALALRMRQFLGRAHDFTPDARATLEHQLATEVVAKVGMPPPGTPGWAVITAVLAERRRRAFMTAQPPPPPPPPPQWLAPPVDGSRATPSTPDGFAPPA
jgi:uncharacterized RDD family membrane protein YckC